MKEPQLNMYKVSTGRSFLSLSFLSATAFQKGLFEEAGLKTPKRRPRLGTSSLNPIITRRRRKHRLRACDLE